MVKHAGGLPAVGAADDGKRASSTACSCRAWRQPKGGRVWEGGRRVANRARRIVCQTAPLGHFFLAFSESLFGLDFGSQKGSKKLPK